MGDLEANLRGQEGCRSEGAKRGREECFHERTGMWQKELHGGCNHEPAASEIV